MGKNIFKYVYFNYFKSINQSEIFSKSFVRKLWTIRFKPNLYWLYFAQIAEEYFLQWSWICLRWMTESTFVGSQSYASITKKKINKYCSRWFLSGTVTRTGNQICQCTYFWDSNSIIFRDDIEKMYETSIKQLACKIWPFSPLLPICF